MLALGILLFVTLAFAAALIAGIGVLASTGLVAVMLAALVVSRWRSGDHDVRS
jgi:hypothetical protein